jgi:hypothetical protein
MLTMASREGLVKIAQLSVVFVCGIDGSKLRVEEALPKAGLACICLHGRIYLEQGAHTTTAIVIILTGGRLKGLCYKVA